MRRALHLAALAALTGLAMLQARPAACATLKDIVPYCDRTAAGQDHAVQYGICVGTIGTIIAMADLMYRTQDMCIPDKTSTGDAAAAVAAYAARHPEAGDTDFTAVAVTALSAAYSCH